jgi:ArsR family transcriptional regulator, arsenate/arsenite/antimonite-responsive transcriptional repressor
MMFDLVAAPTVPEFPPTAVRLVKLLADPTRRRLFLLLMQGETCNCELVPQLGLSQHLISHHIRQFREAGLIRERRDERDARWVYYTVDATALAGAWQALGAALDPSRLGARTPTCGPAAQGCC